MDRAPEHVVDTIARERTAGDAVHVVLVIERATMLDDGDRLKLLVTIELLADELL